MQVPVVYRDFRSSHSDFEPGVNGSFKSTLGIADDTLDAEGKPVFAGVAGDTTTGVASSQSFAQWYRDVPSVNSTHAGTMTLFENGNGSYVNRYTEDGDQWLVSERVRCAVTGDAVGPCISESNGYQDCNRQRDLITTCEIDDDGVHWGVIVTDIIFTSEVRYWFSYDAAETYQLDFTGAERLQRLGERVLARLRKRRHDPGRAVRRRGARGRLRSVRRGM